MRFLAAGLVLIAVAVGLTEYLRRHPPEEKPAAVQEDDAKAPAPAAPPPTMKALLATTAPTPGAAAPAAPFEAEAARLAMSTAADGFTTLLAGAAALRELQAGPGFAVVVLDKDGQSALLRVAKDAPPKVLAARAARISAVALDGATVHFAEGGRLLAVPADGSAAPSPRAELAAASIVALAAKDGVVVAALAPRDGDPFSTEPTGALVKVDAGGAVTLVAPGQVRPRDVTTDGKEAFWVAGYPSGLSRGALDGSFSGRIAERADGPVLLDGDGVVHRLPQAGAPELRRVARAGGKMQTLASLEVDAAAAFGGVVYYTAAGLPPRLYSVKAGEAPKDVLVFKGAAKGLAATADALWLLSSDDGDAALRVRALP